VETLSERIAAIRQRIAAAATRSGRDPQSVSLVAVAKTVPPDIINEAVNAGQTLFGENRVQEAKLKMPQVSGSARWHFIGHLQSNKVRDAVELFEMIQSVDSLLLAHEISKRARQAGKQMPILLEVNVASEATKFGFSPDTALAAVPEINKLPNLELHGLMCIPPPVKDVNDARPYFRKLVALKKKIEDTHGIPLQHLSMGMSHDYETAIEEGATMVRVGTAIFGNRGKI
jgi:pyridoxal phosphate enzyme (YggS family)